VLSLDKKRFGGSAWVCFQCDRLVAWAMLPAC